MRERERPRDQFGGKTSSVGSGPGARQAGKLRKLSHTERIEQRGETIVGMVTLCHPYDEGITCLCDTNKAVLR